MMNFSLYMYIMINLFLYMILLIPSNLLKFHPLNLSFILIIYTIFLCLKMNFMSSNFWYSYILFLIMVGGLMILFMYFTSIANNELINFNKNFLMYFNFKLFMLMMILFFILKMFFKKNILMLIFMEIFNFSLSMKINNLNMKYLYMDFFLDLNLYTILYLFLVMISSVLICKKELIPFRQMNYYE